MTPMAITAPRMNALVSLFWLWLSPGRQAGRAGAQLLLEQIHRLIELAVAPRVQRRGVQRLGLIGDNAASLQAHTFAAQKPGDRDGHAGVLWKVHRNADLHRPGRLDPGDDR